MQQEIKQTQPIGFPQYLPTLIHCGETITATPESRTPRSVVIRTRFGPEKDGQPCILYDTISKFPAESCVELIEHMGNDSTVVNAARVSFDAKVDENVPLTQRDIGLVNYLAKHQHITPFFHNQFRFRIRMPIFLAREWFRHTIGLSRNEVSRRYVTNGVDCFLPDMLREKHPQKKQGSKDTAIDDEKSGFEIMIKSMEDSLIAYEELLKLGVAPEQARIILPQSMMTEFIETGSLAAYARIHKLRYHDAAQFEIREIARVVGEEVAKIVPIAWAALTKNE